MSTRIPVCTAPPRRRGLALILVAAVFAVVAPAAAVDPIVQRPTSAPAAAASVLHATQAQATPATAPATKLDNAARQQIARALGTQRVGFVANVGQSGAGVRFHAPAPRAGFYATDRGMTVALADGERETHVLALRFLGGANPHPRITASEPLPGVISVLSGAQPRTGLTRKGVLTYEAVWPGIDVRFHIQGGVFKYEFLVAPGADPKRIRLAWEGANSLAIAANGALELATGAGTLIDTAPVSFQGGETIATRYLLEGGNAFGLAVSGYDPMRPLVVDPGLVYWTFLGGTNSDSGSGIAVDALGAAYVTGFTLSPDFPSADRPKVAPGYDQTLSSGDAFVVKLDPTGESLAYWTFLGGTSFDSGSGIAVDAFGAAYVSGTTGSGNFPSADRPKVAPGYDQTHNGDDDAFVVKLDPTGQSLAYWTFLGGTGQDNGRAIAIDALGAAYVTGQTLTPDFPSADRPKVAPGYDQTLNGMDDGFVVKLDPTGQSLAYWTFLGGTADDQGFGIAVDALGAAHVSGRTFSPNFPSTDRPKVAPGYDQTLNGNGSSDAFVVKLNPMGQSLDYWTFLGGTAQDEAGGIAVDALGAAYVTGATFSPSFPSADRPKVAPGYDQTHNGLYDAFVVKLDLTGQSLAYWTFLGGTGQDIGAHIAVDALGAAYVSGYTRSPAFPSIDRPKVAPGYDQTHNGGSEDAFVVKLDPTGQSLAYWTFLGGSGLDYGQGIAVDALGAAYVTGQTISPDFPSADQPTLALGYDQTHNGNYDVFVTKLEMADPPATVDLTPAVATNPVGTQHTVTATVRTLDATAISEVVVHFSVTGAVTTSGSCTTDSSGQCSVTYQGPTLPGTDAITAFVDTNRDGELDPGEPRGTATKTWIIVDGDGDGVADTTDNCPLTANPDQQDADADGQGDACDPDDDGDGVADTTDNCPLTANPDQQDADADGQGDACDPDDDGDGVADTTDNCPLTANADQTNSDSDAQGDACDPDDDGDGVADTTDNCPQTANPDQQDADADGQGDACDGDDDNDGVADGVDNCPLVANPGQANTYGDGRGDACEPPPSPDADGDGVADAVDNCPAVANPNQADTDRDGIGDACDTPPMPTSADQCKTDGWKTFGVFKNQGDCVSYVATKGKNPPSGR